MNVWTLGLTSGLALEALNERRYWNDQALLDQAYGFLFRNLIIEFISPIY